MVISGCFSKYFQQLVCVYEWDIDQGFDLFSILETNREILSGNDKNVWALYSMTNDFYN